MYRKTRPPSAHLSSSCHCGSILQSEIFLNQHTSKTKACPPKYYNRQPFPSGDRRSNQSPPRKQSPQSLKMTVSAISIKGFKQSGENFLANK